MILHNMREVSRRLVRYLLKLSVSRLMVLFVSVAVLASMVIVLIIDLAWDRRLNAELEFAGVITPFLDGLLIVGLLAVLLEELRDEVARRKAAEDETRALNETLEAKVQERTRQLVAAQEELVRKEKLSLLVQVADTVGHELRNPLGVLNNAVYFLKAVQPEGDETSREYLGIIENEVHEADRIVSDLLDAVRTRPPRPATVNVAALIDDVLRKCAIPAGVVVRLDIPDALPAIEVDPVQMQQVLWNLLTNSVEAMPDGGVLEIRAVEDASAHAVKILVKDSGPGIAAEHRSRLFQPLFTTKARRVGLGLAVVKNLTQANGGRVEAQSELGKGAVFVLTLPGRPKGPVQ